MKNKKISQNQAYWIPKIERNMQRDRLVDKTLREQGWQVIRSRDTRDPVGFARNVLASWK